MDWPWKKKPKPAAATDAPPIRPEDWVGSDERRNEQLVREKFVDTARRYLRSVPIAEDVVALYFCLLDARTPLWAKGVAAAALAYFVLPTDALPDILPVIGMSDDIAVLSAALTALSTQITPEHRSKARGFLDAERIIDITARPR
jgi:uncharacterized membrane protein YkvA (DUF1232 family)